MTRIDIAGIRTSAQLPLGEEQLTTPRRSSLTEASGSGNATVNVARRMAGVSCCSWLGPLAMRTASTRGPGPMRTSTSADVSGEGDVLIGPGPRAVDFRLAR